MTLPAYFIVDVDVQDPDAYEAYRSRTRETIESHGGRFVVRGGPVEVVEGDWPVSRLVILEFESVERLKEWYYSPEYQAILPIRLCTANSRALIAQGV